MNIVIVFNRYYYYYYYCLCVLYRKSVSSVESSPFGLTEKQRLAKEEEERNVALVEIQLRDEHSFPALGVSHMTHRLSQVWSPSIHSELQPHLHLSHHLQTGCDDDIKAASYLRTSQVFTYKNTWYLHFVWINDINMLGFFYFPKTQLGIQGEAGRKKAAENKRSQRNKTVTLFITYLFIFIY